MYLVFVRFWLMAFLVFIPFHYRFARGIEFWSGDFALLVNRLDGLTIAVFFLLAIREFYKTREMISRFHLILLFPLLILGVFGLISGMINENSLLITMYGVFDYTRNFLVIFIYAAFFREMNYINKLFRPLLIAGVFLGSIAVFQEFFALYHRYILEKDIKETGMYIFRYVPLIIEDFGRYWRLGVYRAPSLMSHPNSFGLYCLLLCTLYLGMSKKTNIVFIISLLTGIFVSLSRQVYTGFMLMSGVQIFRGRKCSFLLLSFRLHYFFFPLAIYLNLI